MNNDGNLILISIIVAYLVGSISPAIMLGRVKGKDIKKEGSGNAGTTNVLRVLGIGSALITLMVDVGKGFIVTYIAESLFSTLPDKEGPPSFGMVVSIIALAVFLGHLFPVFHGFKGGKGVATALGVILVYDWKIALISLAAFIVFLLITRYVSIGSISAAVVFVIASFVKYAMNFEPHEPWISFWFGDLWPLVLMAALLIIKHRSNISRIIKGEEDKLRLGKNKNTAENETVMSEGEK